MIVQKRLADYIRDNGIKQAWISRKTGITKNRLSGILTGKSKLTADEYEKIVTVIGRQPNDFMEVS